MPLRRHSSSDDQRSIISLSPSLSIGTKRRFPLLGRKKNRPPADDIPPSPTIPAKFLQSSKHKHQQPKKPSLRIHVQIKFESPINKEHNRDYEASPELKVSDRLCQALDTRLQHCSTELITRHDCSAIEPLRRAHRDVKPLRYRITYRVERDGRNLPEKSLRSFQEYPLTADDAREVIAATDRIVGLFLVRNDPGFRWPAPPETEPESYDSETFLPCTGRPQAICCIPRSRFSHETQTFELVPGYSIELFLRSRCLGRYPENRNAAIKIDSRQPSPLTLLLGEELATRASNLVIDPVDASKRKFDKKHRNCNGLEGSGGCTHIEDGAVDIVVKVRNNIGPDYNYFSQRIQTSKVLFNDPEGRDFDEFASQVKAKLERARDMSDKSLRSMDDFVLRIRELRGNDWSVSEPMTFRLDSSVTYCRQTVEAIMERLQTGISHVLEAHEGSLATLTAHKRGQLIFDGFLDGAGGEDDIPYEKYASPDLERKAMELQLRERIRADITMLCKDTCSPDSSDLLPNLRIRSTGASTTSGDNRPSSEMSITDSFISGRSSLNEHTLAKKQAKHNLRELPMQAIPDDLRRIPSGAEMARNNGYMADIIADEEPMSEPPSTPSLIDTDGVSPRDSAIVTPQSMRVSHQDQSNEGLRIIEDGRRIIWQIQSDAEAIAAGVTEMHRYPGEHDEPFRPIKSQPVEIPERKASKASQRSSDTRMPDLSGKISSVVGDEATANSSSPDIDSKPVEPKVTEIPQISNYRPPQPFREAPTPPVSPRVHERSAAQDQDPVRAFEEAPKEEPKEAPTQTPKEPPQEASQEVLEEAVPELKNEAAAPTAKEEEKPAETVPSTKSEESHEEPWELVDAKEGDAPQPPPPVIQDVKVDKPSAAVTTVASATHPEPMAAQVESLPEEKPKAAPEAEKDAPSMLEPSPIPKSLDIVPAHTILDDFPSPPPHEETFAPEPPAKQTEAVKNIGTEKVDVPESDAQLEPAETSMPQPQTAVSKDANRHSSDSGIVLDEVLKEDKLQPSVIPDAIPEVAESQPEIMQSIEHDDDVEDDHGEPSVPFEKSMPVFYTRAHSEPLYGHYDENVIASAPESVMGDGMPSPSLPPVVETAEEEDLEDAVARGLRPTPLNLTRPRTNTLPERRYSSALTLDIGCGPFASQEVSPVDEPPKSAVGFSTMPRHSSRHRRQPSAGLVGLREKRMHEVGLRHALMPYRWRVLRREADEWGGSRPGTSYSEQ